MTASEEFSAAVRALLAGERVTRLAWTSCSVELVPVTRNLAPSGLRLAIRAHCGVFPYEPTVRDRLARDWRVVPKEHAYGS